MFCRVEIVPYDEERELYEVKVYINERFFESNFNPSKERWQPLLEENAED